VSPTANRLKRRKDVWRTAPGTNGRDSEVSLMNLREKYYENNNRRRKHKKIEWGEESIYLAKPEKERTVAAIRHEISVSC